MVASSIAKAADDVGNAAADAEDCDDPALPHERLPTMTVVAISPPRNGRPFGVLKAVISLTVGIVPGRGWQRQLLLGCSSAKRHVIVVYKSVAAT
jgi:hypothetical protein